MVINKTHNCLQFNLSVGNGLANGLFLLMIALFLSSQLYFTPLSEASYENTTQTQNPTIRVTEIKPWGRPDNNTKIGVSLKKSSSETTIKNYITDLGSDDDKVKEKARAELIKIGGSAVGLLIEAIKGHDSSINYQIINFVLPQIGKPAVRPLIKALKDDDWSVRQAAVFVLGKIGDRRAVPALIDVVLNDTGVVREDAVETLIRIGDSRAVKPLIDVISKDFPAKYDTYLKEKLKGFLVSMSKVSKGYLEDRLEDETDEDVRAYLEEVLGEINERL